MGESLLYFLRNFHWSSYSHWYFYHLNIIPIVYDYQQGHLFTRDEWFSIALVGMNLLVLIGLAHFLVKAHQNKTIRPKQFSLFKK